jgi:hypothetical protein
LQAAAYTHLDGVHGYAGWRWQETPALLLSAIY